MPRRVDFAYGDNDAPRGSSLPPAEAAEPPAKRPRRSTGQKSESVTPKATPTRAATRPKRQPAKKVEEPTGLTSESESESDAASEDAFEPESDAEDDAIEVADDESIASVDSDDLDDKPAKKKRKSGGSANGRRKSNGKQDLDYDEDDIELEDGQFVAGRIYPAPTTGLVPPGQISQNTLDFLAHLQHREYNDREWFKAHEPAFRMAEAEHRAFVDIMQVKFNEADEELPILPARDICHRIYRDIRFSSDKTPYKCNFGLTYSRSGRKGIWAGYHLYLEPGYSLMACGVWQPERPELHRIRERLLENPQPLRDAISRPEFEALFGKAKPPAPGRRQNVFGHRDMLKVAPKGVDKNHKDIDLLKLRSITVVKKWVDYEEHADARFTDKEVTDPHFMDQLKSIVEVMAPFVHTVNRYLDPAGFDADEE